MIHPHLYLSVYLYLSSIIFLCIINGDVSAMVGVDNLACSINTDHILLTSDISIGYTLMS